MWQSGLRHWTYQCIKDVNSNPVKCTRKENKKYTFFLYFKNAESISPFYFRYEDHYDNL